METCLLNYFVLNNELKSVCDFNPYLFENFSPVYEVVRVEKGVPLFLDDHIQRFFDSCLLAGIVVNLSKQQIKKRIKALIESNSLKTGLIKFLYFIHPEAGEIFSAWVAPFFFPSANQYKEGVQIKTFKGERKNPHAKFANLEVRQQADAFIKKHGIYEVVLVNAKGWITEGSKSNIFFLKKHDSLLFTAHESLVLKGITRQKIFDLSTGNGLDIFESVFLAEELSDFDAAFITGTSPKVLPVRTLNDRAFDVNHAVIQFLKKEYDNLIENYIQTFSW